MKRSDYQKFKVISGRICDRLTLEGLPIHEAARQVMLRRTSKGYDAALLSGLVVGALCEKGHADIGELFLMAVLWFSENPVELKGNVVCR